MVKLKVWIKVKEFSGSPTMDNLKLLEEEIPRVQRWRVFKLLYIEV